MTNAKRSSQSDIAVQRGAVEKLDSQRENASTVLIQHGNAVASDTRFVPVLVLCFFSFVSACGHLGSSHPIGDFLNTRFAYRSKLGCPWRRRKCLLNDKPTLPAHLGTPVCPIRHWYQIRAKCRQLRA